MKPPEPRPVLGVLSVRRVGAKKMRTERFRRRREMHARVGEALERRFAGRTDEAAGLLTHHFVEAGDGKRAWRYSVAAGHRACALRQRRRRLRARAASADELGAAGPDEVAEALGDVCELSAHYEATRDAYRRDFLP